MDPKARIKTLSEELTQHQYLYYIRATPTISDSCYDALFDELLGLERSHPEYRLPDSPSQRVGSDLDQSFPQKKHHSPILSLDKANNPEQVQAWIRKILEPFPDAELIMEDKIDGLSIVLHYEDGLLVCALTRGDGERGNDITENAKTIRQIPLRVHTKEPFTVRGEVFLEKMDFEQLNLEQSQRFSNPRNLAAGSIRLSHSAQVARIPLKFAAHDAHFTHESSQTHIDNLNRLNAMGFPLIKPIWFVSSSGYSPPDILPQLKPLQFKDIADTLEAIRTKRHGRSYEIDGMVFKINQHAVRRQLGTTSHHPRWAIAFKFDAPSAETRLLSIDVQVGRNGRITPVANLEPVPISGSIVSRATLHNQLTIDTLNIGPGDLVTISKRGDVIPAVEEVVKKATDKPIVFSMPSLCPACNTSLQLMGAHHFCANRKCPERMLKQIIFFAAKGQMDIVGLGEQTLRHLFELGHISSVVDIYRFDYTKLIGLTGYGTKKVQNLIASVENSKKRPFSAVLSALGIEGLGSRTVQVLIEHGFDTMDSIHGAISADRAAGFAQIPGVGPALTQALVQFFSDPMNLSTIHVLARLGLRMREEKKDSPKKDGPFTGMSWVITGTFIAFQPREKAAELIRQLGGNVAGTVTATTTHLLVGEKPGSKLEKARKIGAAIITESDFLNLTQQTPPKISVR